VISGDTTYSQSTIDACHGCDVLIHEATTLEFLAKRSDFQPYSAKYHTNTTQLAELASKAKSRLLIIYHASISCGRGCVPKRHRPKNS
jgi:ribonuclease BN (tRNA processing enzyme)